MRQEPGLPGLQGREELHKLTPGAHFFHRQPVSASRELILPLGPGGDWSVGLPGSLPPSSQENSAVGRED